MNGQVVFALGVEDIGFRAVFVDEPAAVTHLSAHFGIERRLGKHDLIKLLVFLFHLAVTKHLRFGFGFVVTHKFGFSVANLYPVAGFNGGGVTRTVFLLLHFCVETFVVNRHIVLAKNKFSQVERETKGIVELESNITAQHPPSLGGGWGEASFEQPDAGFQRSQERVFFFLNHFFDERFLRVQFGIRVAHHLNERRQKPVHKRFVHSQKRVTVANGASQYPADNVSRLGVRRQLPVCDGKSDGAHVVGNHAHGDVFFLVFTVCCVGYFSDFSDNGLKNIGIVIG